MKAREFSCRPFALFSNEQSRSTGTRQTCSIRCIFPAQSAPHDLQSLFLRIYSKMYEKNTRTIAVNRYTTAPEPGWKNLMRKKEKKSPKASRMIKTRLRNLGSSVIYLPACTPDDNFLFQWNGFPVFPPSILMRAFSVVKRTRCLPAP